MSLGYSSKDVPSLKNDVDEVILTFTKKTPPPRPRTPRAWAPFSCMPPFPSTPSPSQKQLIPRRLGNETATAALVSDLTTRHDMVASWLRRGYPSDAERRSADIVTQIVAGSDRTATTIKATVLPMCTHARVLRKLRAELDAAERAGAISSPVITNREALALPYLQAVVREGLRILVPVVAILVKHVPAGGGRCD